MHCFSCFPGLPCPSRKVYHILGLGRTESFVSGGKSGANLRPESKGAKNLCLPLLLWGDRYIGRNIKFFLLLARPLMHTAGNEIQS